MRERELAASGFGYVMLWQGTKGSRAELIAQPYCVTERAQDVGGALLELRARVQEAHAGRMALIDAAIAEVSK